MGDEQVVYVLLFGSGRAVLVSEADFWMATASDYWTRATELSDDNGDVVMLPPRLPGVEFVAQMPLARARRGFVSFDDEEEDEPWKR
jgi:hypothetical protein